MEIEADVLGFGGKGEKKEEGVIITIHVDCLSGLPSSIYVVRNSFVSLEPKIG